ncbi:MAG: hypothetical protein ACLFU4_05990 [Opitutales bacterium]
MTWFRNHLLLLLTALLPLPLTALEVKVGEIRNNAIFGIDFPGTSRAYYARESAVQSVSIQEYLTAAFRVREINVVTEGAALLRIYHSRPLEADEVAGAATRGARAAGAPGSSLIRSPLPKSVEGMIDRSAAQTADAITETTVFKDYPIGTHARTIEFRLSSRSELLELYEELQRHLIREPAYYEDGRIVDPDGRTGIQQRPRSLGGTLFVVEG